MVSRRSSWEAFTLIELLVSIAIIALLMGLLLPVLGEARDSVRAAVCLSNSRQMASALLNYAGEYDESLVPMEQRRGGDRLHWFGLETPAIGGGPRPLDPQQSPLAPHLGGNIQQLLACPAFPADDARFVMKFDTRSAHYGYNARLAPLRFAVLSGADHTKSLHEVQHPSGTVAFADGVFLDGLQRVRGEPAFYEPHYMAPSHGSVYGGFTHFRHADCASAAFLDGHAAAVAPPAPTVHVIAGRPATDLDIHTGPDSLYGF